MNNKENKMGTAPIGQLMIKMAIPVIISMVLQACYNIVDSIFVSHMPDSGGISGLGEYGVNALTLAFPLQMLIGAFGVGTGVGVNALLSRKLGEKDFERVGLASGNGTFLGLLIYAGFIVFGIFGIDPYTFSQTNDPVSIEMCSAYLRINIFAGFGLIFFGIHEKLLQATGKTIYSTIAQITGAAVNLILDPIMIFGFLGMPALGIAGAAWATVIGQIASMVVAVALHYTKNKEVPKGLRYFRPEGRTIKDILSVGVPAIIMQGLLSVMSYGINIIFGNVSPAAVTAYGVFFKMQQFLLYAIFGFRDVITPIISYNYGMKDRQRVMQGIRYGTLYICLIMLSGTAVFEIFAPQLVSLFGLSEHSADLCILAMRIVGAGFIFVGLNMAFQSVFQALNCGWQSLVVSLLRMLIIVLPLAWVFSLLPDAERLIWLSIPIAEGGAAFVAWVFTKRAVKKN